MVGLNKWAGEKVRQRASSPKLLVCSEYGPGKCRRAYGSLEDTEIIRIMGTLGGNSGWCIPFNSAVGKNIICYWSGRNCELDFVLSRGAT